MRHWINKEEKEVEVRSEDFFNELDELLKRHGVSIGHEDGHGSFIIEGYNESNIRWIKNATITPDARDMLNYGYTLNKF